MKWKILLFFILLSFNLSARDWSIELGWDTQFMNGLVDEIVYNEYLDSTYIRSHLFWEIENLWLGGPYINLFYKDWSLGGSLSFPLSKGTGQMEDYDWDGYIPEYSALGVGVSFDEWTRFSLHDVFIEKFLQWNINLSWSTSRERMVGSRLFLAVDYNRIYWEDDPLYYIYSSTTVFRRPAENFTSDSAIFFDFYALSMSLGATFFVQLPEEILIELGGSYSPFENRISSDHHISRGWIFLDKFPDSNSFSLDGSVSRTFYDHFSLKLSASFCRFLLQTGDTEMYYASSGILHSMYNNGAGSMGHYIQCGLSLGYLY